VASTPFERAKVKRERATRPLVNGPMLLLLKEKHGDGHFLVHNDDELFATSLMIVKGRKKQGWYPEADDKPEPLDFNDEMIPKMPASFQKAAIAQLRSYDERVSRWEDSRDFDEMLKNVFANLDGREAWNLLKVRSDHEYEEVRLEPFSKTYGR
jgi:hypothetical protein